MDEGGKKVEHFEEEKPEYGYQTGYVSFGSSTNQNKTSEEEYNYSLTNEDRTHSFWNIIFNIYNLSIALLVFIAAFIDFIRFYSFDAIVVDLYIIAISIIMIILEVTGSSLIIQQIPLMKRWFGRGILYIFLGATTLGDYVDAKEIFSLIAGISVMVMGTLALLFHFVKLQMPIPLLMLWKASHISISSVEKPLIIDSSQGYQSNFSSH